MVQPFQRLSCDPLYNGGLYGAADKQKKKLSSSSVRVTVIRMAPAPYTRQKGPVENPRLIKLLFLIVPTAASMIQPIKE